MCVLRELDEPLETQYSMKLCSPNLSYQGLAIYLEFFEFPSTKMSWSLLEFYYLLNI